VPPALSCSADSHASSSSFGFDTIQSLSLGDWFVKLVPHVVVVVVFLHLPLDEPQSQSCSRSEHHHHLHRCHRQVCPLARGCRHCCCRTGERQSFLISSGIFSRDHPVEEGEGRLGVASAPVRISLADVLWDRHRRLIDRQQFLPTEMYKVMSSGRVVRDGEMCRTLIESKPCP
jgi:hypothetical protein